MKKILEDLLEAIENSEGCSEIESLLENFDNENGTDLYYSLADYCNDNNYTKPSERLINYYGPVSVQQIAKLFIEVRDFEDIEMVMNDECYISYEGDVEIFREEDVEENFKEYVIDRINEEIDL